MTAPLCYHCASTPMLQKVRIEVRERALVIFQCDACKRIEAVAE